MTETKRTSIPLLSARSARGRWIGAVSLIAVLTVAAVAMAANGSDLLSFEDVEASTRQFIDWDLSITLTPEQEAIKKEALTALPAPCCSDNTAYTCCCPCNMSRSIWGLSKHLIVEQGADADTVREKARAWIQVINPGGFSGDVCYTGGCGRPFAKNGCGGMNPSRIVW